MGVLARRGRPSALHNVDLRVCSILGGVGARGTSSGSPGRQAHGSRNSTACGDESGQNLERVEAETFLAARRGWRRRLCKRRGCARVLVKRGRRQMQASWMLFLSYRSTHSLMCSLMPPATAHGRQKDARLNVWFQEARGETNALESRRADGVGGEHVQCLACGCLRTTAPRWGNGPE